MPVGRQPSPRPLLSQPTEGPATAQSAYSSTTCKGHRGTCRGRGQRQGSLAHTLLQGKEKARQQEWLPCPSHLGPCLGLHRVFRSLAGPQRLCLSHCPGEGEVSPCQPSSPLGFLAAGSGGPPLRWLETIQSGAAGVLVVHGQTPRQPLVPCSGEALVLQSQQRARGLQGAWVPRKSHPQLGWPNPSARGGEPEPNPEKRKTGSAGGVRKLCDRDQDPPYVRFCPAASHPRRRSLLLVATAPAAGAQGSRSSCSCVGSSGAGNSCCSARCRVKPRLISRTCAQLPTGAQASSLVLLAEVGCLLCPSPLP